VDFIPVLDVIKHFDHEKGNQEDSENGNFIRRRHAAGQFWGSEKNVNHLTE
jgi:hypothetical protein